MAVSYGYDRTRPRTRITLDSSNLSSRNISSEKPLVLVGTALGGEPKVPHVITDFSQAKDIFRGGDLLDAIELAWSPSSSTSGAGEIIAIRANKASQASLEKGALTVKSKLYGDEANKIKVSYDTNQKTNSKRFTVTFSNDDYNRVYDNIGNIFTIKYTGKKSKAVVDISTNKSSKEAETLDLKVSDGDKSYSTVKSYDLGTGKYERVGKLVTEINELEDFEASLNNLGSNKDIETKYLDSVSEQDVTSEFTVTALAGDFKNTVNNDKYVEVEIDNSKDMPDDFNEERLTGGKIEDPPTSWSDLFKELTDMGMYYIVPLTSQDSIHGELDQFVQDQSKSGSHVRVFVGGSKGESVEELRTRKDNLKSDRVSLVGYSGKRKMSDGRVESLPGYMVAAMVAGVASGLPVGEPITYERINLVDSDNKFTGQELDKLDAYGIVTLEFVRTRSNSYYRIVSDPTTYVDSDAPVKRSISLGETSDFLTMELRTTLDENFIGTRLTNTSASIIKNTVESFLDEQKGEDGLIVDYNSEDVQVVVRGNTAEIKLGVQPSRGLDYIDARITYNETDYEE